MRWLTSLMKVFELHVSTRRCCEKKNRRGRQWQCSRRGRVSRLFGEGKPIGSPRSNNEEESNWAFSQVYLHACAQNPMHTCAHALVRVSPHILTDGQWTPKNFRGTQVYTWTPTLHKLRRGQDRDYVRAFVCIQGVPVPCSTIPDGCRFRREQQKHLKYSSRSS